MTKLYLFQLIQIILKIIPKNNTSISKVNFYATRTTSAHYIPLCAKIDIHGFRELISINKRNEFKEKKKNNPGQPDEIGKKRCN